MKSAKKKSRPGTAMKVKPANEIMADDFFRSPSEVKKKKRLDDPASAASTLSATLPQKKPKSVKKSKVATAGSPQCGPAAPRPPLPPHRLVLAPMVGGSELPFRQLTRKYGSDLCYTPMIYSKQFVEDGSYRAEHLASARADRTGPLVAHFCGNDPQTLLAAAKLAEPHCTAVDLNLGCPQRVAHSGHFGSYLLDETDRSLLLSLVRTLAHGLRVPVFCKIRLLDEIDETVRLCKQLVDAGAALIAVHARYRGSATRRRDGPAHLDQVRIIKQALGDNSAALLTNGNVRNGAELVEALEVTGADGVMCAEGILDDPALFARACLEGEARHRQLRKRLRKAKRLAALADERELTADEARKAAQLNPLRVALKKLPTLPAPPEVAPPTRPALAAEYLALLAQAPKECAVPVHTARFHARRICRDELEELGLLELMRDAESVAEVDRLVRLCEGRMPQNSLEREAVAEAAAAAAAEKAREKRNATRRKEFEDRMKRRARREGKADDEYIRQGLAPPDADAVAELRALQPKERMGWWSARFGQHCLAYHAEGECARSNGTFGCAFLHVKPAAPADEPSAMG